jgi:hypothetical protein
MDGLEKSWPGSACLTRPSPWTYANPGVLPQDLVHRKPRE